MKPLKTLSAWLEKFEGIVLSLALLFMIGLGFLQVILRNFWDTGIEWGDPVVRAMVIWVGFLGASIATHQKSHIQLDLVSKFLPEKAKKFAGIIAHFGSAAVCLLLADAAYKFMVMEREARTLLIDGVPNWIVIVIIPVSFLVMTARFFIHGLDDVVRLFKPEKEGAA
ncbi:TRAP transporter small permease [bacterium]|nr:MAG: TRAP transporter small permease [bacterium]